MKIEFRNCIWKTIPACSNMRWKKWCCVNSKIYERLRVWVVNRSCFEWRFLLNKRFRTYLAPTLSFVILMLSDCYQMYYKYYKHLINQEISYEQSILLKKMRFILPTTFFWVKADWSVSYFSFFTNAFILNLKETLWDWAYVNHISGNVYYVMCFPLCQGNMAVTQFNRWEHVPTDKLMNISYMKSE